MSDTDSPPAVTSVSLRSVSLVTVFSVGQLLVLFLLHVFLAKFFGASQDLDVYLAVLAIPLLLGTVLSGSLSSVIIPLAQELNESRGEPAMTAFLNHLGWMLVLVSTSLAGLVFLAAEGVVGTLYADFLEPQIVLGAELLQIVTWLIPLNTITSYLYSVLHGQQRFLQPAAAGLIGPATTVAIVAGFPNAGIASVAWAVLAGGVVGVLPLLGSFPKRVNGETTSLKPVYQKFAILITPLVLGGAIIRFDPIVDRHLAARLSEGSISHLGYAWRLITSVSTAATCGLSVVAFPALARHTASGAPEKFVSEVAHAWRFLCVVLIPMIGGILCYSETLVAWLFERGKFLPADTKAVAMLMCLYTVALFAAGFGEISARAFYALGKTWTPTIVSILCIVLGGIGKFALVGRFQAEGIAGITSASYLLTNFLFLWLLASCIGPGMFERLGKTVVRCLLCTACALAVAKPLIHAKNQLLIPIGILAAVATYCLLQWLLRDEFALRLWAGFQRQLGRGEHSDIR